MPGKTYDVAVVGFGPVGQLLALLLGRRGHEVLVLERWPQPYDKPRAVHFDHEIGRIFQAAGVADDVMAITDPVPDCYEWRSTAGEPLLRIGWGGTGPSGWPTANFFSQPDLERTLSKRVEMLSTVDVRRVLVGDPMFLPVTQLCLLDERNGGRSSPKRTTPIR